MVFSQRLYEIQQTKQTTLALTLSPKLAKMPLPIQKYDDPFLPFSKAIIDATHDRLCAYLFDLGAYLALGGAGAVALERSIAYARAQGDVLTILHGLFKTTQYLEVGGPGGFNVDAATVVRSGSDNEVISTYSHGMNEGVIFLQDGYAGVRLPPIPAPAEFTEDLSKIQIMSPQIPGFVIQMHIVGDEVLYAGQRDDFEAQVRAALEAKLEALHRP
ncbi:MAG: hypothetical protein U0670_13440 [Anaerolineae bacterium]